MSIKDILVHLDHDSANEELLRTAMFLGDQFDAHLTALHVDNIPGFEVYAEVVSPGILDVMENQHKKRADKVREEFDNHLLSRSARSSFIAAQGNTAAVLVHHSYSQDMIIIRQSDEKRYRELGNSMPEQVVMEAVGPVLVVPYIGCRDTIGKNILVAWSDTREAARAVHDALPFLRAADSVTVMSIKFADDKIIAGSSIGKHLARHGVTAEVQQLDNSDINVAENLLSRAADLNSDMLVMGAYGHTRLREYALGGVTHTILGSMTIPVLLSH